MSNDSIGVGRSTATPSPDRPIRVPLKSCCGLLAGDVCECLTSAAELDVLAGSAICWDLRTAVDA